MKTRVCLKYFVNDCRYLTPFSPENIMLFTIKLGMFKPKKRDHMCLFPQQYENRSRF